MKQTTQTTPMRYVFDLESVTSLKNKLHNLLIPLLKKADIKYIDVISQLRLTVDLVFDPETSLYSRIFAMRKMIDILVKYLKEAIKILYDYRMEVKVVITNKPILLHKIIKDLDIIYSDDVEKIASYSLNQEIGIKKLKDDIEALLTQKEVKELHFKFTFEQSYTPNISPFDPTQVIILNKEEVNNHDS